MPSQRILNLGLVLCVSPWNGLLARSSDDTEARAQSFLALYDSITTSSYRVVQERSGSRLPTSGGLAEEGKR